MKCRVPGPISADSGLVDYGRAGKHMFFKVPKLKMRVVHVFLILSV